MRKDTLVLLATLLSCIIQAPVLADPPAVATSAADLAPAATATDAAAKASAPAATAAAAPSAAAAATAVTPPAAAAAPATSTGASLTSAMREKHFKSEGYQVKTQNGQKYYCRTGQTTGSHFSKEQCYTEDMLARMENLTPGTSASMGTNQSPVVLPKAASSH